jgi:thiosulfate dehydrogenase (quinone) large subunit
MADIANNHPAVLDTSRPAGPASMRARVAARRPAELAGPPAPAADTRSDTAARYLLAGIRIGLGWIFLWAFLDKVFGLGYATTSAKSWLNGGSPTNGFLVLLGIGMRLAAVGGALLTIMMWTAVLPPASNPFLDDHLIYAAVLITLALMGAGNTLGLGRAWASTPLVRRASWLR